MIEHTEEKYQQKKDVLATKEDIGTVKEDISSVRKEIAESKAEVIKWMFIFWLGTIGVLSGIMFAMLHAYVK